MTPPKTSVAAATAPPTTTTTTTAPSSTTLNGILAIVSPVALPACSDAGSASLLVPILGGVVTSKLNLPMSINLGDLILKALGPVYVVCGVLPSPSQTRCQLDGQIAGIWPSSLATEGLPAPNLVGDAVDAINAGLKELGLPPSAALEKPLDCSAIVTTTPAPAPPPPLTLTLPAVTPSISTSLPALSTSASSDAGFPTASLPSRAPSVTIPSIAAPSQEPAGSTGVGSVFASLEASVPGGIVALQLILAALLTLVLLAGWLTSGRVAWVDIRKRRPRVGVDQDGNE